MHGIVLIVISFDKEITTV